MKAQPESARAENSILAEDVTKLVESAEEHHRREIGSVWAGVLALGAGGVGAALRLNAGVCAVVVACTLAVGVSVGEARKVRKLNKSRASRSALRQMLLTEAGPERDVLCEVLLQHEIVAGEVMPRDIDRDPVLWLCSWQLQTMMKRDPREVVEYGQRLRDVPGWDMLCSIALRTNPDCFIAAKRVVATFHAENSERLKALLAVAPTWRGTFDELLRAVGLY
jgi:hypothetical protein